MRSTAPLLFEQSRPGRRGSDLPLLDVPKLDNLIPEDLLGNSKLRLPELAEVDLIRHYTRLSRRNFGLYISMQPPGC